MDLDPSELAGYARELDLHVAEDDHDAILEELDGMLDGLDALRQYDGRDPPDVAWWDPEEDPYNCIRRRCRVPATGTESDRLAAYRIGVKDNIPVAGVPMDCGSTAFEPAIPRTDATAVRRLRSHGATIVAKTNLDEFAASVRGTTSAHGPIRNPHDPDRVAGGSSGGSAVAVETGVVDAALGTDTGGSVRIPASFCGVVGLKPTYGAVPRTGVVEHTYVADHVGVLADSVRDAAEVLVCIAGPDPDDPTSVTTARGQSGPVVLGDIPGDDPALDTLRVGIMRDVMEDASEPVASTVLAAVDGLAERGVSVSRVTVDDFELFEPVHKALGVGSVAASWRQRWVPYRRDGAVGEYPPRSSLTGEAGDLSPYVTAKLVAGEMLHDRDGGLSYRRALRGREELTGTVEALFEEVDVLLSPTVVGLPPKLAAADDPGYDNVEATRPTNVTGHPAVSLPAGTVDGLPVGIQAVAPRFEDARLLAIASALEPEFAEGPPSG